MEIGAVLFLLGSSDILSKLKYEKTVLNPAFSDTDLVVIHLFRTRNISEADYIEIRTLLTKHFMDKARHAADKAWNEKGYTCKDFLIK